MMRIIVTGAAGFVGSRVANLLRRKGHQVWAPYRSLAPRHGTPVYCDLTSPWDVGQLVDEARPDAIVHLAGAPEVSEWGPRTTIANVLTTHNLLDKAPEGCRFVLASSASVYGEVVPGREDGPATPVSAYGAAKLAAEHLVRAFHARGKINGACLRPVAIVGEGAKHGLLPDLVRKLRDDAPELALFGPAPGSVKPFVHVDDAADAFAWAAARPDGPIVMNVANEDVLAVSQVAAIAMEETGTVKPIVWGDNFPGDVRRVEASTAIAARAGWEAALTSERAVRLAIRGIACSA